VYHLPAYVAVERWAAGRVVVVAAPHDGAGARRLRDAGARVIVVGRPTEAEGLEVRDGIPSLPIADGSADVVACIEGYAKLPADVRARLLVEARRVLGPGGLFVAWTAHEPDRRDGGAVDFWTLEREVSSAFARVQMIAQMPWQGWSLAPIVDDASPTPAIAVRESLLQTAPQATHYLALAGGSGASARLQSALQCLLVPVPPAPPTPIESRERAATTIATTDAAELDRLRRREDVQKAELAELYEREAGVRGELEAARGELEATHSELATLRERETATNAELATLRERELEAQGELTIALAELDDVRRRERAAIANLEELGKRMRAVDGDVEALRNREHASDEEINALRQRGRGIDEELEAARRRAEEAHAELERARTRAHESERVLAGLESKTVELEREREHYQVLLQQLEDKLRARDTDVTVLTHTVHELEQSLARASERAEGRTRELDDRNRVNGELKARCEALASEREQIMRQLEVAAVEREGARQLGVRLETELELARRRDRSVEIHFHDLE